MLKGLAVNRDAWRGKDASSEILEAHQLAIRPFSISAFL